MKKVLVILLGVIIVAGIAYAIYWGVKGRKSGYIGNFTKEGFEVGNPADPKKVSYIADPLKIDYGVTLYPGSKASERQSSTVTSEGETKTIGVFTAADSVEKVVSYFQKQIGTNVQTNKAIQGGVTYTVIAKKEVLDPVISVFKDGNTTTYMIIKK